MQGAWFWPGFEGIYWPKFCFASCEIDDDGDGFSEVEGDCDDTEKRNTFDRIEGRAVKEVCWDGVDNNCNGLVDLEDGDCQCPPGKYLDESYDCQDTPEFWIHLYNQSFTLANVVVSYWTPTSSEYKQTVLSNYSQPKIVDWWDIAEFGVDLIGTGAEVVDLALYLTGAGSWNPVGLLADFAVASFFGYAQSGKPLGWSYALPTTEWNRIPAASFGLKVTFEIVTWCWPGGPFGLWDPYCYYDYETWTLEDPMVTDGNLCLMLTGGPIPLHPTQILKCVYK